MKQFDLMNVIKQVPTGPAGRFDRMRQALHLIRTSIGYVTAPPQLDPEPAVQP